MYNFWGDNLKPNINWYLDLYVLLGTNNDPHERLQN